MSLQFGGKIDLTRTKLYSAIPAERSDSSKALSFSRCLPTPLVRNTPFGNGPIDARSPVWRGPPFYQSSRGATAKKARHPAGRRCFLAKLHLLGGIRRRPRASRRRFRRAWPIGVRHR